MSEATDQLAAELDELNRRINGLDSLIDTLTEESRVVEAELRMNIELLTQDVAAIRDLITPDPDPDPDPPVPDPDPEPSVNVPALVSEWNWLLSLSGTTPPVREQKGVMYWARSFHAGVNLHSQVQATMITGADPAPALEVTNPRGWDGADYVENRKWYRHTDGRILQENNSRGLRIKLRRPALVGVIPNSSNAPAPPAAWVPTQLSRLSAVEINGSETPVVVGRLPAGEHTFTPTDAGPTSMMFDLVILEGITNQPTPPPSLPSGVVITEVMRPGTVIGRLHWLHAGSLSHLAAGPDGTPYNTWHPQVDPVYNVWFGHEHGSNPSLFPAFDGGYIILDGDKIPHNVKPLWGYTNRGSQVRENNGGFKVLVWHDRVADLHFMHTIHFESGNWDRVHRRFYTHDFAICRSDGEVLADLHFLADMGGARMFDPDNRLGIFAEDPDDPDYIPPNARTVVFRPDGFENQWELGRPHGGIRNLNASNNPSENPYESWQGWLPTTGSRLRNFIVGSLSIVTDNPMTHPSAELISDADEPSGFYLTGNEFLTPGLNSSGEQNSGARRWFIIPNAEATGFGVRDNGSGGLFYTDSFGLNPQMEETAGSYVRQWVKPHVSAVSHQPGHWQAAESFDALYVTDRDPQAFWTPKNMLQRFRRDISGTITEGN